MKKKKKHNNNNKSQWNVKKIKRKVKKMWRRKSWLGITALICVLIALVSMSTFAWFSTTDAKENRFKSKFSYQVELVEEFTLPIELIPNKKVTKKVSVRNAGDIPAFTRVMVFPVLVSEEGVPLAINEETQITYGNLNTVDWRDGKDGYFYYLKYVNPKEATSLLFDSVTIDVPKEDEYSNASFKIEVKAETIDARNNTYREAYWQADRDIPQLHEPLLTIDETLQKIIKDRKKGMDKDE